MRPTVIAAAVATTTVILFGVTGYQHNKYAEIRRTNIHTSIADAKDGIRKARQQIKNYEIEIESLDLEIRMRTQLEADLAKKW